MHVRSLLYTLLQRAAGKFLLRCVLLLALIQATAPSGPGFPLPTQYDYHRNCQPKEGGGCSHWDGLACGEVDAILLNVRRYEEQNQDFPQEASMAQASMPMMTDNNGEPRSRAPMRSNHAAEGLNAQSPRRAVNAREQYQRQLAPQPLTQTGAAAAPASRTTGLFKPGDGQHAATRSAADGEHTMHSSLAGQTQHARTRQSGRTGADGKMEAQMAKGSSSAKVTSFPVVDTDGHTKYRLGDGLEPSPAFPRGRCVHVSVVRG